MKDFPLYTQHEAMDCGPTCLRMIAAYYGKRYSLQYLRDISYITKEGVSMLGISEAAERIGLHTIAVEATIEELIKQVPLPCILHWDQKHFVVLYKIKKGIFHIADPAGSKVKLSEEEFCEHWLCNDKDGKRSGVMLCMEPTTAFFTADDNDKFKKDKNILNLLAYLKPYKKLILQIFIGLATGSLLQLILPFTTQAIVDFGITNQDLSFVFLMLIAQSVLVISSISVEYIRGWILLHIGTRINISLISDYLAKLMRLPIAYFDAKMTGDILQRIGDHGRIQTFLTSTGLSTLFSIVNIVIFGAVMCFYDLSIFIIYITASVMYVGWIWLFMNRRASLDHKLFTQNAANQGKLVQLIDGMQEIKLYTCENQKRWDWERIQAKIYKINIKSLALAQYQQSGGILINQLKNVITTAFVASLVIKGEITLGMMLSIQYIIGQLNSPIDQLIGFFQQYQDAKLSFERLQDVYGKEDEDPVKVMKIHDIRNDNIYLHNVSFKYNKLSDSPIINNITITIPKGKTTAIVGLSGSGKTTLMKLILGYYQPDKGKILIGSSDLTNFNKREWRKKCGTVMQDGYIFSDTIAKNIAPGTEFIDEERMENAAGIANIKNFIDELPLRYNTKIGAEGHGLSMGQKQRILIARAVYKDPYYVLLDEATNSLDTNNEQSIIEKLNKYLKGKTSIIIAHRLSTVRDADNILVMEHGEIVESGKHDELLRQKGVYYRLVKNQLNV